MRYASILVFALTALGLSACASSSLSQGPSDTLRAYARALDDGRADDAYRLLSDDARRNVSLEAFRRMVKESPADMRELAHALVRPSSEPVVTATVTSPKGDVIQLVLEGGRWRIDANAIDLYGQGTPRRALEAFLRAFDRKRYDILLRFVPDAHLDGLDQAKLKSAWEGPQKDQMQRIVEAVRTALPTAAIEEIAEHATMAYGAGGTVQLVREHGAWKVEDFD